MRKLIYQRNGNRLVPSTSWFLRWDPQALFSCVAFYVVLITESIGIRYHLNVWANPLLDVEWQVEFDELEGRSLLAANVAWDNSLSCPWGMAIDSLQATLDQVILVNTVSISTLNVLCDKFHLWCGRSTLLLQNWRKIFLKHQLAPVFSTLLMRNIGILLSKRPCRLSQAPAQH